MRYILLLVIAAGFLSCSRKNPQAVEIYTLKNEPVTLQELSDTARATAVVFLSPECPLCKNYALSLRQMSDTLKPQNIAFVGVVSGTYFTPEEINRYRVLHDLDFPIVMDPQLALANTLEATITPEAILLDSNYKKVYSGAIDNWAITLGRQRRVISEHYLSDAIAAVLAGNRVEKEKTQAVGCFIQ